MRLSGIACVALVATALAGCGGGSDTKTTAPDPDPNGDLVMERPAPFTGPSPVAGMQDDPLSWTTTLTAEEIDRRMDLVAGTGARQLRLDLPWAFLAPIRPAKPEDPADPAYQWARIDQIVDAAIARKIEVLPTVHVTPEWASDPSVVLAPGTPATARRPKDPADFGAFAVALAKRYAPKGVLRWEAWNEPNIPLYLQPQWVRDETGALVNQSAADYAALANAFIAGIKSVAPNAEVAGPVTAPGGDRCPDFCPKDEFARTEPVEFLRLLDQDGRRPQFDAISHHPYPKRAPSRVNPPNSVAVYVDLFNIDRLEEAADAGYLKGKPLWLTEFGYLTRPVQNFTVTVTEAEQAEYLAESYRRVRDNPRIKILTWFFLQDKPTTTPDSNDWTSGLIGPEDRGSRAKPAHAVFQLPLATDALDPIAPGTEARLVGQVRPSAGATRVVLQARRRGAWQTLRRVATTEDGSFDLTLRPDRTTTFRVTWRGTTHLGPQASLASAPVTIRVAA